MAHTEFAEVNQLSSRAEYAASVAAVPQDVYPEKTALTGIGEEAVLFSGAGARYLVARKDDAGVVIFPLIDERRLSDAHLRGLAEQVFAAR